MKKFIKTFLLTTFLGTFALPFTQAQNTITVGDGTSTYNYAPVYTIYNWFILFIITAFRGCCIVHPIFKLCRTEE